MSSSWRGAREGIRTSRVLFLYPTRATATEGFRDYVSWAPEDDAGLLSGTAAYELKDIFGTPDDSASKDPRRGRNYQSESRLFALGHWKKRIFSATADQFFPFLQFEYGPLCLLPLLAESIVVVDEVHSFDRSMFSTLRRFLREFPAVPVLCMTATLSKIRRGELLDPAIGGLTAYPREMPIDLEEDATHPRYRVEWIDREGAGPLARDELAAGRRVLWVSNRVADCQDAYEAARDPDEVHSDSDSIRRFCYHSRYRLKDRKDRHRELVEAFQDSARGTAEGPGVFGSTTQVCEMSLDLDAQVLITSLAPIASLIQRMGRCNRDSKRMKSEGLIGRVYVIRPEPGKELPYEKEELEAAERFVDAIVGLRGPEQAISQQKLEDLYRKFDPSQEEPELLSPFLDSGPYAAAKEASFRDIEAHTVPCLLDDDLKHKVIPILQAHDPAERIIDGFVVPVPRRFATEPKPEATWFPRWLSVARMSAYDEAIGFDERKIAPGGGGDA